MNFKFNNEFYKSDNVPKNYEDVLNICKEIVPEFQENNYSFSFVSLNGNFFKKAFSNQREYNYSNFYRNNPDRYYIKIDKKPNIMIENNNNSKTNNNRALTDNNKQSQSNTNKNLKYNNEQNN